MNKEFMSEAIRLSLERLNSDTAGPFGAVIAREGEIIGRGWNQVTASNDPTAHAEMVAIREACRRLGYFHLAGCELYSSCEPCPMCLAAAYWARLDRLFFANTRADARAIGFADEQIYRELALPLPQRSMPMIQMMRDEALPAFALWKSKSDKVAY